MDLAIELLEEEIRYIINLVMDLEESGHHVRATCFQIQAARLQDILDIMEEE